MCETRVSIGIKQDIAGEAAIESLFQAGDYDFLSKMIVELIPRANFDWRFSYVLQRFREVPHAPTYKRFYGPQFLLQISGSGLVAPSGMFFNARYSKLHIGNFVDERFKDMFKSDRYKKIMNYLASPSFDAQTMMGSMPIQHYVSEALDNHLKGVAKISPATDSKPLHVNFL